MKQNTTEKHRAEKFICMILISFSHPVFASGTEAGYAFLWLIIITPVILGLILIFYFIKYSWKLLKSRSQTKGHYHGNKK